MSNPNPVVTTPWLNSSDLDDIMYVSFRVANVEKENYVTPLSPRDAAQLAHSYVSVVTRPRMVALIMGNLKNNESVQRDVAAGKLNHLLHSPTIEYAREVHKLAKLAYEAHPNNQ